MIQAVMFDLDGTLVQTEKLKAKSYALAAIELCEDAITEEKVVEAFRDVVGLARREVATALVERFNLESKATARMAEFGVSEPWEAYVAVRLRHYDQLVSDPQVLRDNQWPHNRALLDAARAANCQVALVTQSRMAQAEHVLEAVGLEAAFDFIVTRDDVTHGKPDPEGYLKAAHALSVPPSETLAVEDSPSGVRAALNAGMEIIAVTTPFTREHLHAMAELEAAHIVDDPAMLPDVLAHVITHHDESAHGGR